MPILPKWYLCERVLHPYSAAWEKLMQFLFLSRQDPGLQSLFKLVVNVLKRRPDGCPSDALLRR